MSWDVGIIVNPIDLFMHLFMREIVNVDQSCLCLCYPRQYQQRPYGKNC